MIMNISIMFQQQIPSGVSIFKLSSCSSFANDVGNMNNRAKPKSLIGIPCEMLAELGPTATATYKNHGTT